VLLCRRLFPQISVSVLGSAVGDDAGFAPHCCHVMLTG
jgi:hypothetical protein